MIEGVVNNSAEAVISLALRGPARQARDIEAVIDTGYNGFLTLPASIVNELGLPFRFRGRALLANGREETFDVHGVTVLWDGQPRYVEADVMGAAPLVGMSLLEDYRLYIEVAVGGRVVISAIG